MHQLQKSEFGTMFLQESGLFFFSGKWGEMSTATGNLLFIADSRVTLFWKQCFHLKSSENHTERKQGLEGEAAVGVVVR